VYELQCLAWVGGVLWIAVDLVGFYDCIIIWRF